MYAPTPAVKLWLRLSAILSPWTALKVQLVTIELAASVIVASPPAEAFGANKPLDTGKSVSRVSW